MNVEWKRLFILSKMLRNIDKVFSNFNLVFIRCATETELKSKGFKSASQVARLEDILKDPPKKHALLHVNRIPALSVVLNPTVDSSLKYYERLELRSAGLETKEDNCGFLPGPLDGRSWLLEKNKVPSLDYNHDYFDAVKGADFR